VIGARRREPGGRKRFGVRIAAIAALASTGVLGAAPSALARDGDTQYGSCLIMQDWVDRDGAGKIRLNAQIDGGDCNSVSALIQTSPEGKTLTSFIGGPHVGAPAHS
jgi:hypothetical protein